MFYFINGKDNSLWEENGKVVLCKDNQELQQFGNMILSHFKIEQHGFNGNQQFVMQGINPNAPSLQADEWIDGLFQGFETISFEDWIKQGSKGESKNEK